MRLVGYVDQAALDSTDSDTGTSPVRFDAQESPNVMTSMLDDRGSDSALHVVTLDIDWPVSVIATSTPGHAHLLIDSPPIPHETYMKLLDVLEEAKLIGKGYARHSRDRGFTTVRLPHVRKPVRETPKEEPF